MSQDLAVAISTLIGFLGAYIGYFVGLERSDSFVAGCAGSALGLVIACVITSVLF